MQQWQAENVSGSKTVNRNESKHEAMISLATFAKLCNMDIGSKCDRSVAALHVVAGSMEAVLCIRLIQFGTRYSRPLQATGVRKEITPNRGLIRPVLSIPSVFPEHMT